MVRPVGFHSRSTTDVPVSPSISSDGTTLSSNIKENMDINVELAKHFGHSTRLAEEIDSTSNTVPTAGETSQDGPPLFSKVEFSEHLPCSSSNILLVC